MKGMLRWLHRAVLPLGIPLAWLQLASNRGRFAMALAGVSCAGTLILFQIAAYDAIIRVKALRPITGLSADLVLLSQAGMSLFACGSFPRTRVYQAAALPEVADASPVYFSTGTLRNPATGTGQMAAMFGVEPEPPAFSFPGLAANRSVLRREDALLFDAASPAYFGPIQDLVASRGGAEVEFNGRRIQVRGLFTMGPTLTAECHLIAGTQAYFRLFPELRPDRANLGLLRLRPGADPEAAAARLRALLPPDVAVLTKAGFARKEQAYWVSHSQISFGIFIMVAVSLSTGALVVYQVLYTNVNEHLPEYATLKALGLTEGFMRRLVLAEALLLHLVAFALSCVLAKLLFLAIPARVDLPLRFDANNLAQVFVATGLMCGFAGLMATRRLRWADPADAF